MKVIDFSDQYENLAEAWARHLDKPFSIHGHLLSLDLELIEALWFDVYPEVLESIEIDPISFADTVSRYRHNLSEIA